MKLIMIKKIITNPLFQLAILMMCLPLCLSVMEKTWKIYGSDAYFNKESFVFDNGTGFIEKKIEETGCQDDTTTTWMLQAIQNLRLVDGTDIADLAADGTTYLSDIWTGAIMPFAGPAGPGWLICDGATYDVGPNVNCRYRTLFKKLLNGGTYPLWGTTKSTGTDYATYAGKLKVPDLRGYFLRGSDITALDNNDPNSPVRDTSRTERHEDPDFDSGYTYGHKQKTTPSTPQTTANYPVGTYQGYTYKTHNDHSLTMPELLINNSDVIHTHEFSSTVASLENIWEDDNVIAGKTGTSSIANLVSVSGGDTTTTTASSHSHTITLNLTVDAATEHTETRPKNVAVYFYIKY
jgi:hypothetical protein